ncbi:MAG: hypothetical protein HOM09_04950, partial [Flavobacteriaceae bacterium]|nr:hypothetical protein [Flavobacteriaceae bacterium]
MYYSKSNYFLLFFLISCLAWSQNVKEKIFFKSSNPYSFSEIISKSNSSEQEVFGQLTIPLDTINPNKKYPLIIGVAGSEGWKKHHYEYMKMYQDLGYATFELNSFQSRNIKSTVGKQNQVTV